MGKHTPKSVMRRIRYQVNKGVWTAMFIVWLCVLLVAPWHWGREIDFKVFGTILQLLGVATVAIGIRRTRQDLGDTPLFRQLMGFLSFPPPISADVNITLEGVSSVSAIGHMSMPEPSNGASVSEVLRWVKQEIELVEKNRKAENATLKKELVMLEERITTEANNRTELGQQVDSLKRLTTSGLNLSAYGVVCLLAGVVYGTLPAELPFWGHHFIISLNR